MKTQEQFQFDRIAKAIDFLHHNFKTQPSLDEVASFVHVSPFHFQKLFTEWAGVSPKKFLQYLTVEHAKKMLKSSQLTLSEAAFETGLSGTGRLHDLFVNIEGMTPGDYKNGGEQLRINYHFDESPFGTLLMASTEKGICRLVFADDQELALAELKAEFPNASFANQTDTFQKDVRSFFGNDWNESQTVKLHLRGTDFQLKVWETLLKIPMGQLTTYGAIAQSIEKPRASRAVGTAIGNNPVAFLIPCHRVIQATGMIGGYHWGNTRKKAIIGWEACQSDLLLQE
ncbi:methylated-DNA--[protein]-cysteine S-methyltransferase [Flavobacterium supellecticarium]|uniref:methylated-DNA--[protein]-cysteine S-methyltransferase n=1 Tax=Flavobacterium supellecticarium TaxID=2565924 RepID=A0A4S4A0G6_9FLAO|nr:methylated-DNA--[protein]-cysteine S-methyltransferase [Flavobacterium supellecticarium]THF51632.1 methylated-DNA--[protein]-cysteine S-methyltransferase [Flavobacterium supellecticarium]